MRGGADAKRSPNPAKGDPGHKFVVVHVEMLLQVCTDYSTGIPDARALKASEIRWWYDGLRGSLRKHTAPRKK